MTRQDLSALGIVTTGLALFSAHFGVGDIIFPGKLGFDTGSLWLIAGFGYFFVNTIIAFLGYLAIAKDRVGIAHMAGEILSPFWGKVFGAILMLVVGPVFILPRVASATHEMSILPFFPNVPIAATLAVFFVLNAYVCLNRTAVVDRLGKILSPGLVVFIAAIALKGIFFPIADPVASKTTTQAAFGVGFNFGYNTMNAIAAVLMGGWILNVFTLQGITDQEAQKKNLVRVGFLTVVLLGGDPDEPYLARGQRRRSLPRGNPRRSAHQGDNPSLRDNRNGHIRGPHGTGMLYHECGAHGSRRNLF